MGFLFGDVFFCMIGVPMPSIRMRPIASYCCELQRFFFVPHACELHVVLPHLYSVCVLFPRTEFISNFCLLFGDLFLAVIPVSGVWGAPDKSFSREQFPLAYLEDISVHVLHIHDGMHVQSAASVCGNFCRSRPFLILVVQVSQCSMLVGSF